MRKKSLAAIGVLFAALVLVPAASASAVPSYCTAVQSGNGTDAYCYASAAGTQFRAVAYCSYYISATGSYDYSNFYGPWRTQGDPYHSSVACGAGWVFLSPNAQVQ